MDSRTSIWSQVKGNERVLVNFHEAEGFEIYDSSYYNGWVIHEKRHQDHNW